VLRDQDIPNLGFQGIDHLILNQAEGSIHTGKMMKELIHLAQAKDIRFLWGTSVESLIQHPTKVELNCKNGLTLSTSQLILATNAFSLLFLPEIALQPARNQVLVTNPIPNLECRGAFHMDKGYVYFRHVDHRILIGGGRNLDAEGERTTQFGQTERIKNYLVQLLQEHIIPNTAFEIEYQWSGILGVGKAKRPIIQRVNKTTTAAVRLGGMGVAIGTLVGQQAARIALGD
ncbi:MAG: FAD-dependent oxidoreductase, partial [Bacteroidota bacterium]